MCWAVESNEEELTSLEKYTKFFQDRWNSKNTDWNINTHNDNWTKECMDQATHPWSIYSTGQDTQYLGLCQENEKEKTKFVKKMSEWQKEKGGWSFSICEKDCWKLDNGIMEGSGQMYQEGKENSEKWKNVLFYKK